jgi:hypothetical protein
MKIDLFGTTLFDHRNDDFGIYDDAAMSEEPSEIVAFDAGIAKVENHSKWNIYFVPIDKNIDCLKPDESQDSRCDALLIVIRPQSKYDFYFVELKEVNKDWISDGTKQLETTILNFKENYNMSCLSKKMAFLANKSHPHYHFSHNELNEKFRNETGFRLSICATIPVK